MDYYIFMAVYISVGGVSALIGGVIGFVLRDRALTNESAASGNLSALNEKLRLPRGWLVMDLSQDIVTGVWYLSAFSYIEKGEDGKHLVVVCLEEDSILSAFQSANDRIKNKQFFLEEPVVPTDETVSAD